MRLRHNPKITAYKAGSVKDNVNRNIKIGRLVIDVEKVDVSRKELVLEILFF